MKICCAWCEDPFDTDSGDGWFEPNGLFRCKCQPCLDRDHQGVNLNGDLVQYDEDGNERRIAA